ncbi:solute carrier family 2, facilitated glucose transporter member 8-like [Hydra vulgaris]|uniref:Solute carrier family 2, facilitated glucose transporter member 8-like n=1 Tax=Hydra vulgaris TaxID=6087 RepID=A0ABM4BRX8_HYDVU
MACEVGEKIPLIASQNVFENVEQFKTLFKAVFFASVASASVGFSIGYTSYYNHEDGNIIDEIFFAILLAIGAVFGLVFGVIIIERFGRIAGIMIASIFYIPGWIIIGVCPYGVVIFGRFLTGVATGFCSLTVPIYIVEVSFCRVRGSLMVINQIGLTIGILLASILGYLDNKKIIAGAAVTNAVLMRILVQFIPESPRWLLTKKKRSEALKALLWLRGPLYDIEDECSYIENNLGCKQPLIKVGSYCKRKDKDCRAT